MIHKASVVILTSLSVLCAYLFLAGFWNEHGVIYDLIDGRDTVVVARAYRGSLMFFMGRMTVTLDEATERLYAEDPDIFKDARAYRRQTVLQSALLDSCFRRSTNATRFGCQLPTWDASFRTAMARNFGFVVFPIWAPFLVFAAYPVFAMIRGPLKRRRRRLRNECIHCGYNLTGLVEPRCPECGGANVLQELSNELVEEPFPDTGLKQDHDKDCLDHSNNHQQRDAN